MRYRIISPIIAFAPTQPAAAGWQPRRSRTAVLTARAGRAWASVLFSCALLAPALASAQLRSDANLPGRAVVAGLGLRDAGDLGTAWLAALGVRIPVARRVNGGLTASHGRVVDHACPTIPGARCPEDRRLTAVDLDLEFYYGGDVIHPYGVVSLGVGHLDMPDEGFSRTAFAYSTGLGVGGRVGARAWLFLEGRWRQEAFGDRSARGLLGMVGTKFGL